MAHGADPAVFAFDLGLQCVIGNRLLFGDELLGFVRAVFHWRKGRPDDIGRASTLPAVLPNRLARSFG